jgi:hypothetical protein
MPIGSLLLSVLVAGTTVLQDQPAKPEKVRKDPYVITAAEIESVRNEARTAYDVVSLLRRRFFENRVRNTVNDSNWSSGPRVIINGTPAGSIEALRSVEAHDVKEIRYLSGPDAMIRYGAEFQAGAIVVTSH